MILQEDEIVAINKRQIEVDDYNTLSVFYKDRNIINNVLEIRLKASCRTECEGNIRLLRSNFTLKSYNFKVNESEQSIHEFLNEYKRFPKDVFIFLQMVEHLRQKVLKHFFITNLKRKSESKKEKKIKQEKPLTTEVINKIILEGRDFEKKLENIRYVEDEKPLVNQYQVTSNNYNN